MRTRLLATIVFLSLVAPVAAQTLLPQGQEFLNVHKAPKLGLPHQEQKHLCVLPVIYTMRGIRTALLGECSEGRAAVSNQEPR